MPSSTVPTAPIPVHTGYAVPSGNVWIALASRPILKNVNTRKPPIHNHHSSPVTVRARPKQKVNPTSHSPARIRIIQFMLSFNNLPEGCGNVRRLLLEAWQSYAFSHNQANQSPNLQNFIAAATVARQAVVGGTRETGWGSAMWHSGARGVAAGD